MSVTKNRRGPTDVTAYLGVAAAVTVIVAVACVWAAAALGAKLAHTAPPPANPFAAAIELATGKARWPGAWADAIVAGEAVVVAGLGVLVWRVARPLRRGRARIDVAARHLADRREQDTLGRAAAAESAARLGAPASSPGVPIAPAVGTGRMLYGTFEQQHVDIWGPRTGKTTSRAIPATLDAPGPVLATSNKRDLVDATRGPRSAGGEVYVFDPQQIATAAPSFWWNPLSYVTDVERAVKLSAAFAAYGRDEGVRTDAFFDPSGQELLAWLLLAAAEARLPITQVYRWVSDQTDTQPVDILRRAGHDLPAASLEDVIRAPDKQRGGIYATAKGNVKCLVNPKITRWVTPDDRLAEFKPEQFVRADGAPTLYLLSKEGQGTAGSLVTALTMALLDAAELYATMLPFGRLQVPMLAVLDEAANVCRIKELPDLYSHYGSRGIVLMTILQSWAQGVTVWGEQGMRKLWSAANIAVYGGGNRETQFLHELTQIIGQFEPDTFSLSIQRGSNSSRSSQLSTRPEDILDVADLAAMPRGRALLLASGMRPVLIAPQPWWDGPHAAAVSESIARYAPSGQTPPPALAAGSGG